MRSLSPWIYTTDACNLRCPYCFEEHLNHVMSEETWSAVAEHFLKLVRENKVGHVHFRLSGGEPLTCFDSWREFPLYMKKASCGRISSGLLTNFTLLDDEMLHYLIENKIGCGVSLDGTIHSKVDVNGNSTSKKVMENIEWFLSEGGSCNVLTVLNNTNVGTGEICCGQAFL
ncbi:MAG: radical SAM protein [Lachnospiraceae bacterium]